MRRSLKLCYVVGAAALLASLVAPVGQAHTSLRRYWLALPHAQEMDAEFTATLQIVSGTSAKYVIATGNGSFTSSGTVRRGSPRSVSLPGSLRISSSETVESLGIQVMSDAPIGVTLFTSVEGSEAATAIHPAPLLGKSYVAVGYQESASGDPSGFTSTLTIVGTRAGTSVDVTPACSGIGGAPAGMKIDVELAAGQTWQLRCDSSQDVTGSTVTSDAPIGVFAGNTCAYIMGTYCDQVMEQMAPVARWGTRFFLVPVPDAESDLVRLVTGDDAVDLSITGTAPGFPTSMAAHGHVDVSLDNPVRIVSDKPLYVAQYTRGPSDPADAGDPSMLALAPTSRWSKSYRFFAPATLTTRHLTIVRPNSTSVKIDGTAISGFSAMPGGTHSFKILALAAGQHVIRASAPISAHVHGLIENEAYAFTPGADPVKGPTRTTVNIDKTASKVKASGRVKPHGQGRMVVKLHRKVGGKWKVLATKRPRLNARSRYAAAFGRPQPGRCRVTAKFRGDPDHAPSTGRRTFRC